MSNSTTLITEMSILVGILLLGLLAKLFPRNRHKAKQWTTRGIRSVCWAPCTVRCSCSSTINPNSTPV